MLVALGVGAFALTVPAWSAQSETQQGQQIFSEVQSRKLNGSNLTSEQYTRVGQYVMSRALGSTQTYEAMDDAVDRMMGTTGSDQMYRYLGERYFGNKVTPRSGYGATYGWMASMMRSYGGSGAYTGMIGRYLEEGASASRGSGAYSMMGGGGGMMGYGYANQSTSSSNGWPTGAIVAVALLGALLLGGAIFYALQRVRGHGHDGRPAAPSAS
jgi:hypothetical protein